MTASYFKLCYSHFPEFEVQKAMGKSLYVYTVYGINCKSVKSAS